MVKQSAEFKHQSVRDLAWAINSPPIITPSSCECFWPRGQWFQQVYEESLPWLNNLDQDPTELEELLAGQKDQRMGKYFETLWFYWLTHHSRYQIIESNIQVIIDGETLGEMDLIVFDKTAKKTLHWELAVKFYLGVEDTRDMCNWHGPNLNDHLVHKFNKLSDKQSVLSKHRYITQWLKQQGLVIDECAVILKGRLYYPMASYQKMTDISTDTSLRSPAICAPEHLRGVWCTEAEFDALFDESQAFLPLKNMGWMENISTHSVKNLYTKDNIFEHLSNKLLRLPLQVQVINPQYNWGRVFIVSAEWLQKGI
jgi:uncharacterized protein